LAGQPSNDELFAAAIKDSPSVLSVALGESGSTTFQAKAGFAFGGDDPRPFLHEFKGASHNLSELEDAAQGIGAFNWVADRDQIVRRVALMFRLNDAFVPALSTEALRVAQGASTYLLKASNASGETAFGQATGLNHIRIGDIEIPTAEGGGIYLKFRHFDKAAYIPAWKVASRLCLGAGGICNSRLRGNARFRFAAGLSYGLCSHRVSHHRSNPDRRMGRL
jgi:adenylate cyclase